MDSFGDRIKHALAVRNRERRWLAERCGVDIASINLVIGGHTKALKAENAAKAARALEVDFYWLCTGEGQMDLSADATWRDVARNLATALDAAERGQRYAQFVTQVDALIERASLEAKADHVRGHQREAVDAVIHSKDGSALLIQMKEGAGKGSNALVRALHSSDPAHATMVIVDEAHRSAKAAVKKVTKPPAKSGKVT